MRKYSRKYADQCTNTNGAAHNNGACRQLNYKIGRADGSSLRADGGAWRRFAELWPHS